jgi:hypothetical protein
MCKPPKPPLNPKNISIERHPHPHHRHQRRVVSRGGAVGFACGFVAKGGGSGGAGHGHQPSRATTTASAAQTPRAGEAARTRQNPAAAQTGAAGLDANHTAAPHTRHARTTGGVGRTHPCTYRTRGASRTGTPAATPRATRPCACTPRAVSYTHLTLPTKGRTCRSRWSPYH